MRRAAYYALHYGAEYLAWSVRSVQEAVDEIHVMYAPQPSFGFGRRPGNPCPDTEERLEAEARRFLSVPLVWHRGEWPHEGAHRDAGVDACRAAGADSVLVVDADEVWDPATAAAALRAIEARTERQSRVRFVHFWRSFGWMCSDDAMPIRLILPERPEGEWYLDRQEHPVFHFGYAQSATTIRYKESCHGHRAEWNPLWFKHMFLPWKPGAGDVHPTSRGGYWNPRPTDPAILEAMRPLLHDHPYWGAEIIP